MPISLNLHGPREVEFEPFQEIWVHQGIIPRFLEAANRYADRTAIVDNSGALSYAALRTATFRLADRINSESPGSGAIGILLPRSASFWVAIMACLAAGRPYVALDQNHPAARNAEILHNSGMVAVITQTAFDPGAVVIPATLHRIAIDEFGSDRPLDWTPSAAPAPDRVALVLYTSGSTGGPKGIANNEAALLQRIAQYVNACHLHAGDRFLSLSSPCTIAGTREGLTALLIGATLYVLDPQREGLREIALSIRDAGITIFNSVPSVLRELIAGQADASHLLQSLRIVRIGGEVTFWSDIKLFRSALPATSYLQIGYSSTESTGTQWFVPADAIPNGPFVPVGYVLPGNSASVLDPKGHPVRQGDVGELVLRSRFIALGQWENGLCKTGYIRPDEADPSIRVLHTGDLAQIDAKGVCTIVGRKDRQVKVNGMRVEPAEVEAALRDLAEIRNAAVIARRTGKAVTLAAFVVPIQPSPSLRPRIRAALRGVLPPPMRPARIHMVESIPQLPSGKLDQRALETMDREAEAAQGDSREMSCDGDPIRRSVYRAWRSVLGHRSLDEGVSFEDAGGDSLKLLQLVLSLETALGRRLPLELFTGDMDPNDLIGILRAERARLGADPVDRRPTVFLLPGLDGDEPRLARFRDALNDRLRFVVIEYPDWPDMVGGRDDFDLFVDAAISQIRAANPPDPLLLAGYSFGGDVAFAVASRLTALGRKPGFLGIFDTDLRRIADERSHWRDVMEDVVHDKFTTTFGRLLAKCARDLVGVERTLRHSRRWRPLLSIRAEFAFNRGMRSALRTKAQLRWHDRGSPAQIDVPTVLFFARSQLATAERAPDLGWGARCSDLSVVQVEGDHESMFDLPHRTALCARFADAVEAVTSTKDVALAL